MQAAPGQQSKATLYWSQFGRGGTTSPKKEGGAKMAREGECSNIGLMEWVEMQQAGNKA